MRCEILDLLTMALPRPKQSEWGHSLEEFVAQRPGATESAAAITELREKVKQYEDRYNLPSDRLHAAVASGELEETLDICDWLIHYDILQYVEWR